MGVENPTFVPLAALPTARAGTGSLNLVDVSAGLGSPQVSKECPVNTTRWSAAALAAGLSLTTVLAAAPAGLAAQTRASQHASSTTPPDARLARFYDQHVRWHRGPARPARLGWQDT
jgi:hypothetical protein